jgi:hypothetical protein
MDRATIQAIKQRLSMLRAEEKQIRFREKQLYREREVLEKTLADLQVLAEKPGRDGSGTSIRRQTGLNAQAILSILEQSERPLTVRTIARMAHESGRISSRNGYPGVYNAVRTVLTRNRKSLFVKVDRGTWDIKDREVHHTSRVVQSA